MKRLAQITAVILVTVIGALALWQMREAVQLLLIALAAASGVEPWVQQLQARRINRASAVGVAYVAALAVVVLVLAFFGSLASAEVVTVLDRAPLWYDQGRAWLQGSAGWMATLGAALPSAERITTTLGGPQTGDVFTLAVGVTAQAATLLTLAISAATLGFYWLLERQRIERLWLSLMPLDARTTARSVWQQVYDEVGVYVRGETVIVILSALALLGVYTLLGVPGAGVLALLGGLAQVIPLLGMPLAIIPALAIALSQGPAVAGLTLLGALYVLSVVHGVVGRRVFRQGVNVNPVLVMFFIIVLADLGGILLILLAPPLAAAVQASLRILTADQRTAPETDRQHTALLRARLEELEQELAGRETADPRLADLLRRAQRLVDEAAESLPESAPSGRAISADAQPLQVA
jgi:predicted PurR-regulated permease PerM